MKIGFNIKTRGKLKYLTIPAFEETGLVNHCFTTRLGGVSESQYRSLNLGLFRDDNRAKVLENYRRICEAIEVNYKDLVLSDQVHGDRIRVVIQEDKGKGITKKSDIIKVDGLVTNEPKVPLITFYADCVPLFFLDPIKKVIGVSHAGWRGTVKKIGVKTLLTMEKVFGCDASECLVGIGPSIGQCCYEVDEPVIDEFRKSFQCWSGFVKYKGEGKWDLDLWKANVYQLKEVGVKDDNITLSGLCTSCRNDLFYSYRKDKGKTGSLAAIIELR